MVQDDLAAFIERRTRRNPRFPLLVAAAEQRRAKLRHLAALRVDLGLSQTQIAAHMHPSQPTVARIESGAVDVRLSTLERYAAVLGRRVVWTLEPAGKEFLDACHPAARVAD
ncbi:MAG: helix-turn-helix transcriptional regulator [Chloroflexi bacterium]|nr:helix-turn-helix transcriptional regulator [Chloroflexota bacterium]